MTLLPVLFLQNHLPSVQCIITVETVQLVCYVFGVVLRQGVSPRSHRMIKIRNTIAKRRTTIAAMITKAAANVPLILIYSTIKNVSGAMTKTHAKCFLLLLTHASHLIDLERTIVRTDVIVGLQIAQLVCQILVASGLLR